MAVFQRIKHLHNINVELWHSGHMLSLIGSVAKFENSGTLGMEIP